jgi:tRNA(Ile)-lysidine synthase
MLNQHVIKRYDGELFLLHSSELVAQQTRLVDSQESVSWNSKYVIEFHSSRKASGDLTIPRSAFDPNSCIEIKNFPFSSKFKPKGKTQHKPLTQWFKQWKIPPWQRSQIPQLWVNGQLVALLGVAVADQWPLLAEESSPVYVHLAEVNVSAITRS